MKMEGKKRNRGCFSITTPTKILFTASVSDLSICSQLNNTGINPTFVNIYWSVTTSMLLGKSYRVALPIDYSISRIPVPLQNIWLDTPQSRV